MKEVKKHRSVQEQVSIMKARGLHIQDDAAAEEVLHSINYYRLSGYLHSFRKPNSDHYVDGLTFERILNIYDFDHRLTRLLLFALENIEETLKTRLSYTLSSLYPDNPLIYKDPSLFRSKEVHADLLRRFQDNVSKNKELPFVKHHITVYGGEFPIWVAIELFTMGNLYSFYKNLITLLQKTIAKEFYTGPKQLENWIRCMSFIRNHLAHNMRIYHFNFGYSPLHCSKHKNPASTTNMIFDHIFVMSVLHSNKDEWNNYILPELSSLLEQYAEDILLCDLGFPKNWESILRKP